LPCLPKIARRSPRSSRSVTAARRRQTYSPRPARLPADAWPALATPITPAQLQRDTGKTQDTEQVLVASNAKDQLPCMFCGHAPRLLVLARMGLPRVPSTKHALPARAHRSLRRRDVAKPFRGNLNSSQKLWNCTDRTQSVCCLKIRHPGADAAQPHHSGHEARLIHRKCA
jgi:hypothetical protein